MPPRFLLLMATLCVSSVAVGQTADEEGPSLEFDAALRAADREGLLARGEPHLDPTERCILAMLHDQALREVHVPETIRFTDFDRGLLESARSELLRRAPTTMRRIEECLSTLDSAEAFNADAEDMARRHANLAILVETLAVDDVFAAFPRMRQLVEDPDYDVSWRAIRSRYAVPEAPGEESWRSAGLIAGAVTVGASAAIIPLSATNRDINSPAARLTALGVALGGVGGLMVAGVWQDPSASSTTTRLTYGALWALGSLAGGIALLRADIPRRFQLMGAGLIAGGAVDVALWAGALGISLRARRQRTRFSLSRHGGGLSWSGSF